MPCFSNLKETFRNSLGIFLSGERDPSDQLPASVAPFDALRLKNLHRAPDRLPALFQSRERSLGDPALLFAGKAKVKGRVVNQKQAKLLWLDLLESLKPYGLRGQIAGINSYLNRFAHAPALARLGQKSRLDKLWTAPLRVFHNAGSEHIAFAKYLSLRHMGISADRLRLVWINDRQDLTRRVVLAATLAGRNYILDSRRADIIEDQALIHFRPYCSTSRKRFSLHWSGDDKDWKRSLKQLRSHALH